MKITVVGAGYVGLVASAGFAEMGHDVTCIDNDHCRVDSLVSGRVPFYEPGLSEMVEKYSESGTLRFVYGLPSDLSESAVVVIAVGTPQRADGSSDLSALNGAIAALAPSLVSGQIVVVKSTVPVGTGDAVQAQLPENVHGASNPEFLREGSALADFLCPDRIVVGVASLAAEMVLRELYASFDARLFVVSRREAELAKYAANAFLAMKVTFANEMADLAACLGASYEPVRAILGSDPRIGDGFLMPGPGYGGSCFPKDVTSLWHQAKAVGAHIPLVSSTSEANKTRLQRLGAMVARDGDQDGLTAILGGAFKAGTGDIRESRGVALAEHLTLRARRVLVHDPMAASAIAEQHSISSTADLMVAVAGAHRIVVMTEWEDYRRIDWRAVSEVVAAKVIFDFRGVIDVEAAQAAGFEVTVVGRPAG